MPPFFRIAPAPLLLLPALAQQPDAHHLVEAQVEAAAAAVAVLEKAELSPAARAERLLPLAGELARLYAARAGVDAARLEEAEARAAADTEVQQLALRLLRAIELCAAADYAGAPELAAAVRRLSRAIEGAAPETEPAAQATPALTEQSGVAPAR